MRGRKMRSGVNWQQGVLKQKEVKQDWVY